MAGCVTPPMEYQKNGWVSTEDWNAYIKDLVDVNLGFTTGPLLTVKGEVAFSTEVDITASTTQSQGQGALTKTYNEISVCAHADDVVTMPSAVAGKYVYIANNGAENLQIFPASGDNFQDEVTDASLTLANGGKFIAWAEDDTIWQYDQGTNPAGSNTQIQYNNSGMFGADSGLTWSGTFLTTSGIIRWGAGVGELTYNGTTAIVRAGAGKLLQFGPAAGTHYPLVMQVDGSMDIADYRIGYDGSAGGLSFDASNNATFTDSVYLTQDGNNLYWGPSNEGEMTNTGGNPYILGIAGYNLHLGANGSEIMVLSSGKIDVGNNTISDGASRGLEFTGGASTYDPVVTAFGLTIGDNTNAADFYLKFDGNNDDITIKWMEDESYLTYDNNMMMLTTAKIYFRDTEIYISSIDDGNLDLTSNDSIRLNAYVDLGANQIGYDGSAGGLSFDASHNAIFSDRVGIGITPVADLDIYRTNGSSLMLRSAASANNLYFKSNTAELMMNVEASSEFYISQGGNVNYQFGITGVLTLFRNTIYMAALSANGVIYLKGSRYMATTANFSFDGSDLSVPQYITSLGGRINDAGGAWLDSDGSGNTVVYGSLTAIGGLTATQYPNIVCNDNQVVCHNNEVVTT